jgi:16S rRNA (guanine(527)-N(7))-methyltransferase RsmG
MKRSDRSRAAKRPVSPVPVPRLEVPPEVLDADWALLLEELRENGVELTEQTLSLLRQYGNFLVERSQLLNLVGPADRPRIFSRHISECLSPPLLARAWDCRTLVDIGSGAGLPGIPLALACPNLKVVLVEPRLRKSQFLESAITLARLSSRVSVYQGTADSLGRDEGPRFQLGTARAVGRLPAIWEWSRNLLEPGGWLAVFKGAGEVDSELGEIGDEPPTQVEVTRIPGKPRVLVFLQT